MDAICGIIFKRAAMVQTLSVAIFAKKTWDLNSQHVPHLETPEELKSCQQPTAAADSQPAILDKSIFGSPAILHPFMDGKD